MRPWTRSWEVGARLFGTLHNAKSDKLKPDIIAELSQRPVTNALGVEPT